MKLQPDKSDTQTVTAYGPGWVAINNEKVEESVVIGSRGERFAWNARDFGQLDATHFAQLAALGPELIIFGNARAGTPLMQSVQTVGIDLPLKVLVWEDAPGKTWLSYNEPSWIARRHGVRNAEQVVSKMGAALSAIARKAANPN